MASKQSVIKNVEHFAKDVKALGIHLKKVILFGSYAKGAQSENSDVDVALVADEFTGIGFMDISLFVKALRKYIIIHPKTFSTEHFNKGDAFINEIIKTGIEIKL